MNFPRGDGVRDPRYPPLIELTAPLLLGEPLPERREIRMKSRLDGAGRRTSDDEKCEKRDSHGWSGQA
jgi:hypothetical protein